MLFGSVQSGEQMMEADSCLSQHLHESKCLLFGLLVRGPNLLQEASLVWHWISAFTYQSEKINLKNVIIHSGFLVLGLIKHLYPCLQILHTVKVPSTNIT